MSTIWRARYESRSFDFEAYGTTEVDARETLTMGLNHHRRDYPHVAPDWFEPDDIQTVELTLGVAYRDREAIQ